MRCTLIEFDDEMVAVVCSSGHRRQKCWQCKGVGNRLCDFVLNRSNDGKPIRTCDRPICSRHSTKGETPDVDFCSEHSEIP